MSEQDEAEITADVGILACENRDYLRITVEPKGEPLRRLRISRGMAVEMSDQLKALLRRSGDERCQIGRASVIEGGKLQDDLAELLALLGMPTAAQSRSPHEVFQHAIAVLNDRLARPITSASVAAFREALPSPLYGTAIGEVTEAEWRVALEAAVAERGRGVF